MNGILLGTGTTYSYEQLCAMVVGSRQLVATWREYPSGVAREEVVATKQGYIALIERTAKLHPSFFSRVVVSE